MKSILFMSLMNGGAWGGSEELWFQTALYAARHGYKVGCALYDWPQKAERIEQLRDAGCKLYIFKNRGNDKGSYLERLQHKINKRVVKWYAHRLPLSQYDRVVINLGYLEILDHYWKRFFYRLKNYTLLFHVYDDNDHVWEKRKGLLRQWLLRARHNLFASDRIKTYLEKEIGIKVPNADTLINPLCFNAPEERMPYPSLHNGNYLFVMLATLDTRRKAQDNQVKALSLPKWKERNWQLNLYGGGEDEQKLRAQVYAADMGNKITVAGHTKDVKGALKGAHLLLQMTHIDAMPLAVMEALAMGRPMAVSNVGDMPKWVLEDVNGWVGKNASVEGIDATLEKAWQARHHWEEMGKASFQIFKEKFPPVPEAYLLEQLRR
ncbi:MAG: glycosyltransferase family 4 protein [Bacteroidota bacterium]|nr:glycosyltransferase family 4 protein [Bacteroidota bacterium]